MRLNRVATIFSVLLLAGSLSAPAFAQQPYDGTWNVTL
jgi:hypothetical protein